jgi:hypothetical protein
VRAFLASALQDQRHPDGRRWYPTADDGTLAVDSGILTVGDGTLAVDGCTLTISGDTSMIDDPFAVGSYTLASASDTQTFDGRSAAAPR